MPRPANPGWSPKTIKLSNEVIEAVWVQAAREGKTPGRLINDILARVLLQPTDGAKESEVPAQAPEVTAPIQPSSEPHPQVSAPAPSKEESQSSTSPKVPPKDEQKLLFGMINNSTRFRLGTREEFFSELSRRCGFKVGEKDVDHWRRQGQFPDEIAIIVKQIVVDKNRPD